MALAQLVTDQRRPEGPASNVQDTPTRKTTVGDIAMTAMYIRRLREPRKYVAHPDTLVHVRGRSDPSLCRSRRRLWNEAFENLSEDDKKVLRNGIDISKLNARTMPTQVLASVEEKKNECIRKQWRFTKKNGDEIMLREVFEKMSSWINKFQEVGDVVTQYDPAHAALPWAGMRILLQVRSLKVTSSTLIRGDFSQLSSSSGPKPVN